MGEIFVGVAMVLVVAIIALVVFGALLAAALLIPAAFAFVATFFMLTSAGVDPLLSLLVASVAFFGVMKMTFAAPRIANRHFRTFTTG